MFQQAAQQRPIVGAVATLGVSERVTFLRKTYAHLAGAIAVFVALEYLLLDAGGVLYNSITVPWMQLVQANWIVVIVMFMGAAWIANKWATSDTSRGKQYLGLGLYILAEALIFVPLLMIATLYHPGAIMDAAVLTLFLFGGLTATVFITKKDFSFMRGALSLAGFGALGLIVLSSFGAFELGTVFTGAMILLACGYVLFYTSAVLHDYRPTQYVAASLALFAAIALLFYYILMFIMSLSRD